MIKFENVTAGFNHFKFDIFKFISNFKLYISN